MTVLFGGGQGGGYLSDTWEWDGSNWTQRASGGPPARWEAGMVYDTRTQRVLLFGGRGLQPRYADTWEWDGLFWVEHFNVPSPSPREKFGMAFDSWRGRAVVFGGMDASGSRLQDTWEWGGLGWQQVATTGQPPPAIDHRMVFDSARGWTVLFGGTTTNGNPVGHWEYSFLAAAPAGYTPLGLGCPGSAGVPTLAAAAGSLPYIGETLQLQLGSLPPSPVNVPFGFLGFSRTIWNGMPLPLALNAFGMPGCSAYIAPEVSFLLANNAGMASWPIPIPLEHRLVGLHFFVQGLVTDPGTNPGGMVVTRAGDALIGRR